MNALLLDYRMVLENENVRRNSDAVGNGGEVGWLGGAFTVNETTRRGGGDELSN